MDRVVKLHPVVTDAVVEDCGKTVDEITVLFGDRVASIVEHCTDGVPDETGDGQCPVRW